MEQAVVSYAAGTCDKDWLIANVEAFLNSLK